MKHIRFLIFLCSILIWTDGYSQWLNDTQTWEEKQAEKKKKWDAEFEALKKSLPDFPKNCVLIEFYPSCYKGDGYFFSNGSFLYEHWVDDDSKKFTLGRWYVQNDSIIMIDSLEFGLRGFGTYFVNEESQYSDCPNGYYNDYVKYEKLVNETHTEPINIYLYPMSDYGVDTSKRADRDHPDYKDYFIDGDFKVASVRFLNDSDLETLSKAELRLMRNEIFARYGYIFNDIKLQAYFTKQDWYKPKSRDVLELLTDIEKNNIRLIQKFERK